ncbi:MAG: DUF3365 domain-containing protein [Gammaproteobacteria bacterium]
MKSLSAVLLTAVVYHATALAAEAPPQVAESRAAAAEFMQTLKGELMQGLQAGGPVNAIGVCKLRAPAIAAEVGERKGWQVGRTSLKLRNPVNAPDDWERAGLESFEQRKQAGEDPATLEYYAVVEQEGKPMFRYMKAIPTVELCVTCHGETIDPAVAAKLAELYPGDQARGYQAGDIRGAFTFIEPLPSPAD